MSVFSDSKRDPFVLLAFTFVFLCFSVQSIQARQNDRPFSIDLNLGGGLIGNSGTGTAFQPELGLSYMPGKWGMGLNAGLYNFDSGFSPDQYRAGFEDYTVSSQDDGRWRSYFVNAGPRFQQNLSRVIRMKLGLDLSMNYQEGPSQTVRFNDPTGEMEGAGFDTDIVLAEMNGSTDAGWSAAIRPQLQFEFRPGFSDRFSFNVTSGIQHHLSAREVTYSARDLSEVRPMDNVYEMHFQFENAPFVQRTESAPRTNFFASAGISIRFGKSSRGLHHEGVIHRDIASRNSAAAPTAPCPSSAPFRCPSGECVTSVEQCPAGNVSDQARAESGDCNDEGECPHPDDAVELAQDYNSSRSNKPRTETPDGNRGGDNEFVHEANVMARLANPAGIIISAGKVAMSSGPENPLYEESGETENPLYEGMANNGGNDSNGSENGYPPLVQQYEIRPTSYCVSLSTMRISTNSQKAMRSGAQNHNSSRSNRSSGVANPDLDTGDTGSGADSTVTAAIDAQNHNSSRSNRSSGVANPDLDTGDTDSADQDSGRAIPPSIQGIAVNHPSNLRPDMDQDGFPLIMKNASFSISKRSARTGRSQSPIYEGETGTGSSAIYQSEDALAAGGGDLDGDGYGDVAADGIRFDLQLESGDPDSDDDGLPDGLEDATFSISGGPSMDVVDVIVSRGGDHLDGARSGGDENPLAVEEMEWVESPAGELRPPNNVYQWTYELSALTEGEELPGEGTLSVIYTGGAWHFSVQLDPDDDGDGYGDQLQNSSFSISKRSARTGR